jgi:hypothetical protein
VLLLVHEVMLLFVLTVSAASQVILLGVFELTAVAGMPPV